MNDRQPVYTTLTEDTMKPAMISLCDKSGVMAQPWAEAGIDCFCVDIAHQQRRVRTDGLINFVWGDARSWTPPDGYYAAFVAAFSPCTDTAVSGARDFINKGLMLLNDALVLFNACHHAAEWSNAPYVLENPVSVLSSHIRRPDYLFDPCEYGDPWTKKTCLWTGGGFVMPPECPVEPWMGSKMHKIPPGEDRQDLRSETPPGFADAVCKANINLVLSAV